MNNTKISITNSELGSLSIENENKEFFCKLLEAWSSPYVARSQVEKFSGGIISPKTLANADSLGIGPKTKFCFGKRKVFYLASELAEWIFSRVTR